MALSDLLERGYFPKELPDPFVTRSFASAVTASGVALPADFDHDPAASGGRTQRGKHTKYSHARGGLLRRQLCLANPVLHYRLCREVDSNWATLHPSIAGTALSATNPVRASTGRAIGSARPQGARRALAVQTRLNNRFILKADISRFYHSVYTHSIPWALHTKPIAKANRSMGLLGNRLDFCIRNAQDGQTVGIPIGPDTSLVIAEILMQRCDKELLYMFPGIRGHRFIDDFELGFRHRAEAENAFHLLEQILADYELALNLRKTEVVELPCNLEEPWASPLRSFEFRTTRSGQAGDLFRFFDLAFGLRAQYPDKAVVQFAVGRLRHLKVDPANWELFQHLLLGCAAPEPAALPYVLESIIMRVKDGAVPALAQIEEVVDSIIVDHCRLAHSSEVAWALSACLALNITLSPAAAAAVSECEESVVALLALQCESEGLVGAALDDTVWSGYMNQESLYEDHWLLAYEANAQGWLPSQGGGDHVSGDPNFGFLKAAGVFFYDVAKAVPAGPGAPPPVPTPPTPPYVSEVSLS